METPNLPTGLMDTPATPQIRLAQIGAPGSGKTEAARTFPNLIVGELDRKSPPGTKIYPFYDPAFCASILGLSGFKPGMAINQRDAIKKWLRNELPKLPADYTFCFETWTMLQNIFNTWGEYDKTPYLNQKGEYDQWKFYKHKLIYFAEIMELFKTARCNVIINAHEQQEWDQGKPTGKIKALTDGQFGDQFAAHVTAFVRTYVLHYDRLREVTKGDTSADVYAAYFLNKQIPVKYFGEKTPRPIQPKDPCYVWQVKASDQFIPLLPASFESNCRYIPAHYDEFMKRWVRKEA